MSSPQPQDDLLDKTIKFLAKREGIDKTLKIARYASRLVVSLSPKDYVLHQRLAAFEKSVGVSRKAFRLGKFLQDVNSLRKSNAKDYTYFVEVLAYGGEGIYYFIEQVTWLVKAGALSKDVEAQLATLSSLAELVGYVGSIYLSALKLHKLAEQEADLAKRLDKLRKEDGPSAGMEVAAALAAVRFQRRLRLALIVQDMADSVIALNDLRGGKDKVLGSPLTLALSGLLSGSISFYKNWKA